MDLKEGGLVDPERHWYYRTKLEAIARIVESVGQPGRWLIDVGAGSGFFARGLVERWRLAGATCVDPNYSDDRRDAGPIRFRRTWDGGPADLALFIDVLEHVDDDVGLLAGYVERLTAGALVVVSVPAFRSLWGPHDEFLEHRRRYRLSEVVDLCDAAGLEVLASRYLFGLLFPIAWLVRRLTRLRPGEARSDMRPLPLVLDRVLAVILGLEHRLLHQGVAGLSAVVVGRVRPSDEHGR